MALFFGVSVKFGVNIMTSLMHKVFSIEITLGYHLRDSAKRTIQLFRSLMSMVCILVIIFIVITTIDDLCQPILSDTHSCIL